MKRLKRIFTILLAGILALTAMPAALSLQLLSPASLTASAETTVVTVETDQGTVMLTYTALSDGTISITSCPTDAAGSLEIPATIDDTAVTAIGKEAFLDCTALTGIELSDSITTI